MLVYKLPPTAGDEGVIHTLIEAKRMLQNGREKQNGTGYTPGLPDAEDHLDAAIDFLIRRQNAERHDIYGELQELIGDFFIKAYETKNGELFWAVGELRKMMERIETDGPNECEHKTKDGICELYSDDEVREPCVEGPCKGYERRGE